MTRFRQQMPAVLSVIALTLVFGFASNRSAFAQPQIDDDQQQKNELYLPLLVQQDAAPATVPPPTPPPTPTPSPTPTPTPSPTPTPAAPATSGDFAGRVVELLNRERTNNGCSPLAVHAALMSAALEHSTDMALNDFFDHIGTDNSQPWDRMTRAGYAWSQAAENIAAGYVSPENVVAGWIESSKHRENILNCNLRDTGVGYYLLTDDTGSTNYSHYWTQVFGTPR